MTRFRWLLGIMIAIAIIGISSAFLLFHRPSEGTAAQGTQKSTAPMDLGIVYLPVTSKIADCYGLEVDSGAMVTQVDKGGLVDRAGIKVGDVILSFNGVEIGEEAPLLGMMRTCPMENDISLVVWSNGSTREVTIVHPEIQGE